MVEAAPAQAAQSGADMTDDQLQQHVLTALNENGVIADTAIDMVEKLSITPAKADAALKSLLVDDYVVLEVIERRSIELSQEGKDYVKDGTPEFQYASALVLNEETLKTEIEARVGA